MPNEMEPRPNNEHRNENPHGYGYPPTYEEYGNSQGHNASHPEKQPRPLNVGFTDRSHEYQNAQGAYDNYQAGTSQTVSHDEIQLQPVYSGTNEKPPAFEHPPAAYPGFQQQPYQTSRYPNMQPQPLNANMNTHPPSYGNAPPAYGNAQGSNWQNTGRVTTVGLTTTHVITTQPAVITAQPAVVLHAPILVRPPSYMVLSCFTLWCCNFLFGGIALIFSCLSMVAADGPDTSRARGYGRVAMYLNIAGITITWTLLFVFFMIIICS